MSLNEVLSAGFSAANRRLGGVFLDLVWKIAWAAMTGVTLLLLASWISAQLGSIQVNGIPLQNPVAAALLTRELWNRFAPTLFWMGILAVALSKITWVFLEAYFRAGIISIETPLPLGEGGAAKRERASAMPKENGRVRVSFFHKASRNFRLFVASSVMKTVLCAAAGALLLLIVFARYLSSPVADWRMMWPETRSPFFVALVIWLAIWFAVTLLETLIRSGSLDLLGTDLFTVLGLMATLLTFEGMMTGAVIIAVIAVSSIATGPAGTLMALAAAGLGLLGLTILHSYLLMVRFSSVAALESSAVIIGHVDV
jgi:hypothetical protein